MKKEIWYLKNQRGNYYKFKTSYLDQKRSTVENYRESIYWFKNRYMATKFGSEEGANLTAGIMKEYFPDMTFSVERAIEKCSITSTKRKT